MRLFIYTLLFFWAFPPAIGLAQINNPEVFKKSYIDSCYKTQRAASVNKNMTNGEVSRFCGCMADYLSEIWNDQYLLDMHRGLQKIDMNAVNHAGRYCANQVLGR